MFLWPGGAPAVAAAVPCRTPPTLRPRSLMLRVFSVSLQCEMEESSSQKLVWDGDAKAVQQCLTDIFTSVYTTCDIPENAIFGPCVLSHTSLFDSIAFIALKSTDKRTAPYIFRVRRASPLTHTIFLFSFQIHLTSHFIQSMLFLLCSFLTAVQEKAKLRICSYAWATISQQYDVGIFMFCFFFILKKWFTFFALISFLMKMHKKNLQAVNNGWMVWMGLDDSICIYLLYFNSFQSKK